MKQHERTHKGSISGSASDDSNSRRSKAAATRDAQRSKTVKKQESTASAPTPQSSTLVPSPLSQTTSVAASNSDLPIGFDDPSMYPDTTGQVLMPIQPIPENISPNSLYPPLVDETILGPIYSGLPVVDKALELPLSNPALPIPLIRGFSDLDTLAQVAETMDPSYYPIQNI